MQIAMVGFNFLDLAWVLRLNLMSVLRYPSSLASLCFSPTTPRLAMMFAADRLGVPDKVFLFGEDVIGPILDKLLSMPMYILVAKHMPPGVEATLFALEMGLVNIAPSLLMC